MGDGTWEEIMIEDTFVNPRGRGLNRKKMIQRGSRVDRFIGTFGDDVGFDEFGRKVAQRKFDKDNESEIL